MIQKAISGARTAVRNVLHLVGYDLVKFPRTASARSTYAPVTPFATYSPWNIDPLFLETYAIIKGSTLVDMYRCYELWTLVEQSMKVTGNIIEVGVWRGGTGALIARKAALCGGSCQVYLCDTFSGVPKASVKDTSYKGGEHADTSRELVEFLLSDTLKLSNVTILQGIFPEETASLIAADQATFRFCHIDVDVYQSAKDIFDWIWQRMPVGGIVVYDDYGASGCEGITNLVNAQSGERDRIVVHNLNGHAVVVKTADRCSASSIS